MSVHCSYSPRMHQNSEMTRSNMGSTLIPYLFDDGCCARALFCGALEELVGAIVFHRRSSLKTSQSRAQTSSYIFCFVFLFLFCSWTQGSHCKPYIHFSMLLRRPKTARN